MAARKNRGTKESPWSLETRKKIQTSMLLKRLTAHVLGEVDMRSTQVQAALGLLRKSMPDLLSTSIDGDGQGGPINHKVVVEFVRAQQAIGKPE